MAAMSVLKARKLAKWSSAKEGRAFEVFIWRLSATEGRDLDETLVATQGGDRARAQIYEVQAAQEPHLNDGV